MPMVDEMRSPPCTPPPPKQHSPTAKALLGVINRRRASIGQLTDERSYGGLCVCAITQAGKGQEHRGRVGASAQQHQALIKTHTLSSGDGPHTHD